MARCLIGTKPLSKPLMPCYHLGDWEHISVKYKSKYNNVDARKWIWICLQRGGHFFASSLLADFYGNFYGEPCITDASVCCPWFWFSISLLQLYPTKQTKQTLLQPFLWRFPCPMVAHWTADCQVIQSGPAQFKHLYQEHISPIFSCFRESPVPVLPHLLQKRHKTQHLI